MMTTFTVKRLSPVRLEFTSPSYVPSKVFLEQQNTDHKTCFLSQFPGFGSRHLEDDTPFTLWNTDGSGFRYPTSEEMTWIVKRYDAIRISVSPPELLIYTNKPPKTVPYTVAALLARFVPEESNVHCSIVGAFKPLSPTERSDLLKYSLYRYEFPPEEARRQIINKLCEELDIRAVHFVPPIIIVEIDVSTGRTYARKSLPGKAGGQNIMYHESPEGYWEGNCQKAYESYLPACASLPPTSLQGGLQTSQWRTTTSGVMLQNGAKRRMTAANHGFPDGQDVYHPHLLGRRIGQIVTRHLDWDIALVQLDPSIAFTNTRYFEAPSAQRLIPVNELLFGDWFEVDGISTGRIDLCARSISQYPSLVEPNSDLLDAREWKIEVGFSSYGASGATAKDGVCGAPIVDRDGRVAGFFSWVDPSGLFAFTPALDPLIASGWSIV